MLVVFSDVNISDETISDNVDPDILENIIMKQVEVRAKKKDVNDIHLVLLGDIFDLCRTDWWLRNTTFDERPWNGNLNLETAMNNNERKIQKQYMAILESIFSTSSSQIFVDKIKQLPNRTGKEIKITYIIGDNDRALHNFEDLREKIKKQFKPIEVCFHSKLFAPEYGVLARHGHEWDENTHGWEFSNKVLNKNQNLPRFHKDAYKIMAIGEVINAELMSGLIYYLGKTIDPNKKPDVEFLNNFMDVNNLQPITDVFHWIDWFTQNQSQKYENMIRQSMLKALNNTLESQVARLWDRMAPYLLVSGDIIDSLKLFHKVLSKKSLDEFQIMLKHMSYSEKVVHKAFNPKNPDKFRYSLEKKVPFFQTVFFQKVFEVFLGGGEVDDQTAGALMEWEDHHSPDMKKIQYVVYGHTHKAKREYFSGTPDGKMRMYINTGTFFPLIQRIQGKQVFSIDHRIGMVFFYKEDEDKEGQKSNGPSLDFWNLKFHKYYV